MPASPASPSTPHQADEVQVPPDRLPWGVTFGPLSLALLAGVIIVLAGVAVWAASGPGQVAAWWPAAGVSVLAVAWAPRRRRATVVAVIVLASAAASHLVGGRPIGTAVGFGIANGAEAAVVAWWLLRGRARPALRTLDDVVRLFTATALGVAVMGVLGAAAVSVSAYGDALVAVRAVVPSHAAAILTIVPIGMVLGRALSPASRVETAVQWAVLMTLTSVTFYPGQVVPLTFLPVPFLVWTALRSSPRVTALQVLTVAVVATSLHSVGGGPFVEAGGLGPSVGTSVLQCYLVTLALVTLPLAVSVTMRRSTLEAVRASERLHRAGFSESLVGMLVLRRCGGGDGFAAARARHTPGGLDVLELNPVAARLLGGAEDRILGTCWTERLDEPDRERLATVVADMAAGRLPGWRGEVAVLPDAVTDQDARVRWLELALSPLSSIEGEDLFVGQVVDVTARREAEERLLAQTLRDSLTGLANRARLDEVLAATLADLPGGAGAALLFCDLDDFKNVNDSAGHTAGDAVLVEVARRLESVLHPGDLAARLGGDEFVVLRPAAKAVGEAQCLAAHINAALAVPVLVDGQPFTVGTSVGVVWGGRECTPHDMLRDADAAMYAAKGRGKRRAVVFAEEHRSVALRSVRLDGELRRAIDDQELEVHLQPVVDLRSGAVVAAEALVRWQHPDRGLLPPGEWLDVAEASGLMPEIGAWVLERSCAEAATWPEQDGAAPLVHVNVSARQLEQEGFVDVVTAVLERTGLPPRRLVLEFTETHLDQVSDALLADLARLRAMGIELAADDYGTGYSPLTRVIDLPISMIKIDRRFVAAMNDDVRSRAVVTTLVRLGHGLSLDVVAEGVETAAQASALRDVGCRSAQGYLWSRPVPADEFRRYLGWDGAFHLTGSPASPGLPQVPSPLRRLDPVADVTG